MPKASRKRRLPPHHDSADPLTHSPKPKTTFRPFDDRLRAEEHHLTETLFGGASSFLRSLDEAVDSGVGEEEAEEVERKPAWTDDEDEGIDVGRALRRQKRKLPEGGLNDRRGKYGDLLRGKFTSAFGTPKWATLDRKREDSEANSDDEVMQTCGFISEAEKPSLPKGTLEFKKVKDLNCETYSEGPFINCIEFNTASTVALVAGSSGVATLYAVDGKRNNKLHSVAFQNFPIFCGKFLHNGQEAVLGSRHPHIFVYDLNAAKAIRTPLPKNITNCKNFVASPESEYIAVAGKWGEVHLLCGYSKERICVLKQNSEVTSLAFDYTGKSLYGHSDTGEITIWDLNTRRVSHRWTDEGCLHGSSITVAPSEQFVATGSAEGAVNLYNKHDVLANTNPKPMKSILNLTTRITSLQFNSSSEVLALSSVDLENSVKLFHVGSGTVFSNFPSFSTKLGRITAVSFSPNSGYVAFGNRKSSVSLYRLKHFKNY